MSCQQMPREKNEHERCPEPLIHKEGLKLNTLKNTLKTRLEEKMKTKELSS